MCENKDLACIFLIPTTARKVEEMVYLLNKVKGVLLLDNIWVNPDYGLKTRKWEETKLAIQNMVKAAKLLRKEVSLEKI